MGYLQSFTRLAGENLQAQRLREQFRIIHETSQNLSGTLQENLIYDSILTKALEITNADCGWIYRYEADEDRIILTAKAGDGAGEVPTIQLLQEKKGGISGKVAATGKSLYVPDVTQFIEDTYDPWREYIPTPGLVEKSILAVPLRRGERTLGVLTVNSRHPDFFIPDDIQFLTGLAAVAAVGMERQKLARHLEEVSRNSL
jgi:GAF domain-containing protein